MGLSAIKTIAVVDSSGDDRVVGSVATVKSEMWRRSHEFSVSVFVKVTQST